MMPGILWSALAGAVLAAVIVLPLTRLTRRWGARARQAAQIAGIAVVVVALQLLYPTLRDLGGPRSGTGLDPASLETTMFEQVPALRTVARREPGLWRQALDRASVAARAGEASGAAPGTGPAMVALRDAFTPLLARLAAVAVGAGDDAVLRWAGAENALNTSLLATDAVQCGRRLQNSGFRTDLLSANDAALLAASQDAKVAAYEEGLQASPPAQVPGQAAGSALVQKAVALPGQALPTDEAGALADLGAQPPDLACRTWTHFNRNMLALPRPQAATLARLALGPPG